VTMNIAYYSHFHDQYLNGNNSLDLDYYVLSDNLLKAKQHFQQVKTILACFEKYFGPYPFPRDGYALVETNYWGMEHQSAISYGNYYENNKEGFDYIIVHESSHEWWGNNVSCSDLADMWIHESFATYAETLFLECTQGNDAAINYIKDQRWQIADKHPVIGPYNVNFQGTKSDNDMYYKGAWMLHTFRNVLSNDSLFFSILKNIQGHFALQTINSTQLIVYINQLSGHDYSAFFNQYLHYPLPPVLQYKASQKGKNTKLQYRWKTDVTGFLMPVEVTSFYQSNFGDVTKKYIRIEATNDWQTITIPGLDAKDFDVNADKFYVRKESMK
jgi:aminopeptidase N